MTTPPILGTCHACLAPITGGVLYVGEHRYHFTCAPAEPATAASAELAALREVADAARVQLGRSGCHPYDMFGHPLPKPCPCGYCRLQRALERLDALEGR